MPPLQKRLLSLYLVTSIGSTQKKLPGLNWHSDAEAAAAPASLTVVSGRQVSHELDTSSQNLRWTYLGIPCSRANLETLAASCKEATANKVARLEHLDRYVPERYVVREADRRLFAFWQNCLRHVNAPRSSKEHQLFIPLVADSGVGKTSLLAHFAQRGSLQAPVLLLLARDLLFRDDAQGRGSHSPRLARHQVKNR